MEKITLTISKEELEMLIGGLSLIMEAGSSIGKDERNHIDHEYKHRRNSLYFKLDAAKQNFKLETTKGGA